MTDQHPAVEALFARSKGTLAEHYHEYRLGKVTSVRDGDTVVVEFKDYNRLTHSVAIRSSCGKSPELNQPGGTDARDQVRVLLAAAQPTVIIRIDRADKYHGRYNGDLTIRPVNGEPDFYLFERMVETGFAERIGKA